MRIANLVMAAATLAVAAPGAAADADPRWGIFAEMAGKDYYYTSKGYAFQGFRVQWVTPNAELRLVEMVSKKNIFDCRLVPGATVGQLTGTCVPLKGKERGVVARVDADGSVVVSSVSQDWMFGETKLDWGRYRHSDATDGFERRDGKLYHWPLIPVGEIEKDLPGYAKWLPEAMDALGPIGAPPPSTGPGAAPLSPAPAPASSPQTSEPPPV